MPPFGVDTPAQRRPPGSKRLRRTRRSPAGGGRSRGPAGASAYTAAVSISGPQALPLPFEDYLVGPGEPSTGGALFRRDQTQLFEPCLNRP